MSAIPTKSRELVHERDDNRCVRCGTKPQVRNWHHRRGRSVPDDHQHAPCNGVTLCPTCHKWVHEHPFEARKEGWIVARHLIPCEEPCLALGEWVLLAHSSANKFLLQPDE